MTYRQQVGPVRKAIRLAGIDRWGFHLQAVESNTATRIAGVVVTVAEGRRDSMTQQQRIVELQMVQQALRAAGFWCIVCVGSDVRAYAVAQQR